MALRIVAGEHRGRKLTSPPGTDTRPTSDRVREATFNALGSLAVLGGARVLDGFAGTGALGIEALSRGASSAVFIDRSDAAVEAVRRNLRSLGLEGRAEVRRGSVGAIAPSLGHFDVALLDPPYDYDEWSALLGALDADWVVVESDRSVGLDDRWDVRRSKVYGGTVVEIARRVR